MTRIHQVVRFHEAATLLRRILVDLSFLMILDFIELK